MTPEDIARERANAMQEMRTDYSPVASPWQGLARVAENLMGAIDSRRADTASAANATDQQRIVAALMGGDGAAPSVPGATPPPAAAIDAGPAGMGQVASTVGGLTDGPASGMPAAPAAQPALNPAIVQAMTSPYVSDDVRQLATIQYRDQLERARHQAPEPPEFVRLVQAGGTDPNSTEGRALIMRDVQNRADPVVTVPLPDGRTYVGPRSAMQAALGGGSAAHGGPPATLAPDFFDTPPSATPDLDNWNRGGPTPQASDGF